VNSKKKTKNLFALPNLGYWSAIILSALVAVYMVLLGAFVLSGSGMPPREPLQTAFHVLMIVVVPITVFFWALLHKAAPGERKVFSLTGLAFITGFASLVTINRFVALTVVPQSIAAGNTDGLQWLMPYTWPSLMLAIEILGWGFFFGLACLSDAFIFRKPALERWIFWSLLVTGILNLVIILSQILSLGALMAVLAPIAWGVGPLVAFILMARWFRRQA
jgi:hypothetical protein